MEKILGREKFDGFIHLGDGMTDAEDVASLYPSAAFISVPAVSGYSSVTDTGIRSNTG